MLYNWLNLTQMEWLISWVGLGVLDMRIKTKITASHTFNEKRNKQTKRKHEYESDLCSNEHYLSSSENKAWKNSGLYGIWTHDLTNTNAALYQLS